jgi:uncharacterized protein
MLFIISPAKALDFSTEVKKQATMPVFADRADRLAAKLKKKSPRSLKKLFHVSEDLAQLNYDRFQNWDSGKLNQNGKKALHAFNGHVYQKIDVDTLSEADIQYANDHLRILSGMYGVLKPGDLILPHRLEMGTKWPVTKRNLYGYWTKHVTKELNKALKESGTNTLVNLASIEYAKVVDRKELKGNIIDVEFKEGRSDGKYAVIGIFAKQARGSMCRFAFQNKVRHPEELMGFDVDGYLFNSELSTREKYVFIRG